MAELAGGARRAGVVGCTVAGVTATRPRGITEADARIRLPVAVSILVGREWERAEVAQLVAQARLVTLTGSGGCGKTGWPSRWHTM